MEKRNKEWMGQIENSKMIDVILTVSIITLSVKGLNTSIKRWRLLHWINKQNKKPTVNIKTHID